MFVSPELAVYPPVQGTTLSVAAQLRVRFCLSIAGMLLNFWAGWGYS